ncbi:MAG: PHB depolymerase family esterase [Ktedonobacteraceae bacterium]
MNNRMQAGMAEVMRLMQAGQLAEATRTIQRTLGSAPTADVSHTEYGNATTPIEAEPHVVDSSPPPAEASVRGMLNRLGASVRNATARPVATSGMFSPGALKLPDSMHSLPGMVRPVVPEEASASTSVGGQFVDRVYSNVAGSRNYKLYIPSGYTGHVVPLVIMLHGCTQTPADFAVGTGMNVLAEKEMFLVAYPEQAKSANSSKCWNWFQSSDQQRDMGEPSLIAGITQQIMGAYNVDSNRVYVAGLSSGGAMAAIMAATYPDLYAAVGVHSGLAYGAAHDLPSAFAAMNGGVGQHARPLARAIPIIMFHGDRDTTVATTNADSTVEQWLQTTSDGSGAMHETVRDAVVERGRVAGGHAYTRSIYYDVSGRAIVEKWMVHQSGHAWSGGNARGSYTDSKGPDASSEMVRFFHEHPRGR